MRRNVLILAVLVVILLAGAVIIYPFLFGPGSGSIRSVITDKDLYHSKEIMGITVSVSSQGNMANSTLIFRGLKDRHGEFQLDEEIPVNLSPGPNMLVYEHQLPSCSSCSGLSAGTYQIEVALAHNGIVISNMTRSIDLEQ